MLGFYVVGFRASVDGVWSGVSFACFGFFRLVCSSLDLSAILWWVFLLNKNKGVLEALYLFGRQRLKN